jgi:hypothetical protein
VAAGLGQALVGRLRRPGLADGESHRTDAGGDDHAEPDAKVRDAQRQQPHEADSVAHPRNLRLYSGCSQPDSTPSTSAGRQIRLSLYAAFSEDFQRDLIAVECPCGSGVRLKMNEQLDDLVLGNAIVEGDPQLAAQRFTGSKGGRDGH